MIGSSLLPYYLGSVISLLGVAFSLRSIFALIIAHIHSLYCYLYGNENTICKVKLTSKFRHVILLM